MGWREGLLLDHGLPHVFWQFVANCRRRANVIFPWPLASLTALRALQHLAIRAAARFDASFFAAWEGVLAARVLLMCSIVCAAAMCMRLTLEPAAEAVAKRTD